MCLSSQIIVDVTVQWHVQQVRFIQTTLRMKDNKNFLSFVLFFIIISEYILILSGFRIISECVLAGE